MKKLLSSLLALSLGLSLTVLPVSALTLEDAKGLLAANYVDEIPPEILELDDLDAILEALGDPWTFYMDPEQYIAFDQSVNGQTVVGIGASVELAYDSGGYRVLSILPDSPALEAGILPGDILTAVDGVPMSPDVDPRVPIGGEEGAPLTVTVNREGEFLEFNLIRRTVSVPIVTFAQDGSAGVITCISFGNTAAESIQKALQELDKDTAVWIMDLRSNPGGSSEATAASASLFAGGGTMLYFRDGSGKYHYTYTPSDFPDMTDKPVIVLTSAHSASGSELFAGDIRTYKVGIALGQRSLGKGTAQIILDERNCEFMENGEALKLTAYRFFSPDGATNHIIGILPTLLISPDNTMAAAMLLTQPKPSRADGYLKLEIAGQTFYIDAKKAVSADSKAAFTELLEALPPSAKLYEGNGTAAWAEITPAGLAQKNRLDFTARTFSDVAGSPYAREINTLATYLILDNSAGDFRPGDAITRAQFCAMIASALDLPDGKSAKFSDVSADAWYAGAVSAMADMGFISGLGDGTFRPDGVITYQEMAVVLHKVAAWSSMEGYNLDKTGLPMDEWVDYLGYAAWAQAAVRSLNELDALVGDLAPADPGTYELAAAMLCRLMENIHLIWD